MLSKIEVGKTYRGIDTKRSRKVLFVGEKLVVIKNHFDEEVSISIEDALRLWEEIPEELWVNVYPGYTIFQYTSKQEALKNRAERGETYRLVKE